MEKIIEMNKGEKGKKKKIIIKKRDFLGGPVVKTSPSNAGDVGLILVGELKFPYASQPKNENIQQKQCCNKFNEDFKNGQPQKYSLKKP